MRDNTHSTANCAEHALSARYQAPAAEHEPVERVSASGAAVRYSLPDGRVLDNDGRLRRPSTLWASGYRMADARATARDAEDERAAIAAKLAGMNHAQRRSFLRSNRHHTQGSNLEHAHALRQARDVAESRAFHGLPTGDAYAHADAVAPRGAFRSSGDRVPLIAGQGKPSPKMVYVSRNATRPETPYDRTPYDTESPTVGRGGHRQ